MTEQEKVQKETIEFAVKNAASILLTGFKLAGLNSNIICDYIDEETGQEYHLIFMKK